MRRPLLGLSLLVVECLALSAAALATGPGGWNHLGAGGDAKANFAVSRSLRLSTP